MTRPLVLGAFAVVLGVAPRARGDAVPPEPEDCPPGTVGAGASGGAALALATLALLVFRGKKQQQ
jgi:hypothetical protein